MGDLTNVLLVRWSDGFVEVEDAASVNNWDRVEGFLSAGTTPSAEAVNLMASAIFTRVANPGVIFSAAVTERGAGDDPYTDWEVGDRISVPGEDLNAVEERVLGITVTEDDVGNLVFSPELSSPNVTAAKRLERIVKRMANGTLGGLAVGATPVEPPPPPPPTVQLVSETPFSHPSGTPLPDRPSGPYVAATDRRFVRFLAAIGEADTVDTVFTIRKNGALTATVTIVAGSQVGSTDAVVNLLANYDVLTIEPTEHGTQDAGATVLALRAPT